MTDAAAKSIWQDLPDPEWIEAWQKVVPDAAERILSQFEQDAAFFRKNAERRLLYALVIAILTLAAAVMLAFSGKTVPSVFASSGGTLAVAVTLITGRSPSLARRRKRAKKTQ